MIILKDQIFYVLWDRLRELEIAEERGYPVAAKLEKTRSVLREFPDAVILSRRLPRARAPQTALH